MQAVSFIASVRRWLRSEDGGVMPLVGVACLVLVGAMGLAVDAGRATIVYAKLLNSADASGLAVGARLSSTDLTEEAKKFVNANFPAGYAGATLKNITASASDDGSVITVKATAEMPTTLLRVLNINSVDLNVTSQVTRAVSGLELVLALDNTGSMNQNNKLASAKTAAKDLLDIVFGADSTATDLFVGVVPFSQAVNIGPSQLAWMKTNSVSNLSWGRIGGSNHSWAGCVEERTAGHDISDQPPTDPSGSANYKFSPYYWQDNSTNDTSYYWDDDYNPNDWRDWTTNNGNRTYSYNISFYRDDDDRSPNKGCPLPVTGMTSNRSTVTSAIANMTATGNTHINLGAVWGWRMLSPRWRGYWGGDMAANNLPLDYDTPRMNKAIVLMTDGDNTMSRHIYTAYSFLANERLGTDDEREAEGELDARLLQVCNSMKDSGIIVYTVAFGTMTTATKQLLELCATQPDYYFYSPNGDQLKVAFKTIGDSLANLRVSK